MCNSVRICNKCGETLPLTEEFFSKNQSTNTGGNKYYRPDCKKCNKLMVDGRKKAYNNAGKPAPPNFGYDSTIKRTENGYPCDNCGKTDYAKQIVFDHDHNTLEFRGWLCDACNRSLGILGDDMDGLCNSISYLLKRVLTTEQIKGLLNKELNNITNENRIT
jgi:hypothetical protein